MKHLLIGIIALFCLSSCGKDIIVSAGTGTGSLTMKPMRPTPNTYVTVNDKLLVEGERVKSVTITGIDEGGKKVVYKSQSDYYETPIDIEKIIRFEEGEQKTEMVTVPPVSKGYWIYNGLVLNGLLIYAGLLAK
jgi:hypothetical protein